MVLVFRFRLLFFFVKGGGGKGLWKRSVRFQEINQFLFFVPRHAELLPHRRPQAQLGIKGRVTNTCERLRKTYIVKDTLLPVASNFLRFAS